MIVLTPAAQHRVDPDQPVLVVSFTDHEHACHGFQEGRRSQKELLNVIEASGIVDGLVT